MDDALVLTEGEPRPAHGAVPLFSREPGRRHEAHRREAQRLEPGAPAGDPLAGGPLAERQKLTLARGAAPGAQLVREPAREPDLVVALAV